MAQNVIASFFPDLNPAFNPMKYIINSTNKNEEGFRYIFDLYEAGTATKMAEWKKIPKPVSGYGEVDLARICQSLISCHFNPELLSREDAPETYFNYDLKVGEEFVVPIDYTSSLTQNGLYVKITATHTFVVGDQVTINQDDGGAANPNLQGLFSVVEVTGTTDFTVSSLWSDVTDATIDGTVLYADNRKTITRDITNLLDNTAWNGVFSFVNFLNYNENDYELNTVTDKLLTTLPSDGIRITPEQSMWMNAFTNEVETFVLVFENDGGDKFEMHLDVSDKVLQACVASPDIDSALTTVSGTSTLVKSSTKYYDFWIESGAGSQVSQKYRITIDRRCRFNDYEIAFMDRGGSIASFAFQLKDKLTGSVSKNTYNRHVDGAVVSNKWSYKTWDKGTTSINHSVDEVLELNTNYLNQAEINYFTELISSPFTYIKVDGVWIGCIIETTSYEVERTSTKRLNRKTIRVKYSNQDVING